VETPAADESDGNNDEDQMDDMIANIGMEYDLGSGDQHPLSEVQNPCHLRWKSAWWHRFDYTTGGDTSYGVEIEVQLLESMLQWYREVDYWSHPNEEQHAERLVPIKEDCCQSWYKLWEDWCVRKEMHVVLEGAQGWYQLYALWYI
jgi:hypothetical protein